MNAHNADDHTKDNYALPARDFTLNPDTAFAVAIDEDTTLEDRWAAASPTSRERSSPN